MENGGVMTLEQQADASSTGVPGWTQGEPGHEVDGRRTDGGESG